MVVHRGASDRLSLRLFSLGGLPELRLNTLKRHCPKWDVMAQEDKAWLSCCPCGQTMPQDARHALFECAYTAPARAAAVRAMSQAAGAAGIVWGPPTGIPAKEKFGAMLAPRCIPCLPVEVSAPVRRAGVAAWVREMSACRKTIVQHNDGLPAQAKLIGEKMSGVRRVLIT